MEPLGMGLLGILLGSLFPAIAWIAAPAGHRRDVLLLGAAADVAIALALAALGATFAAGADACTGGLECIGPAVTGGIHAGMAWSAAIGVGLAAAATVAAALVATPAARTSS